MPTGQLKGHLEKGHVLVAEAASPQGVGCGMEDVGQGIDAGGRMDAGYRVSDVGQGNNATNPGPTPCKPQPTTSPVPVGYCIGVDKYFKREDVGVIYQMNIAQAHRGTKVGALLLQAMFDRWAYGVRLCCCWCAQDLAANRFWEAMGFVPLAFRTGSRRGGADGGGRVHIFWQKPIRERDALDARRGNFLGWWYPSQTGGGAIREDRIVLPIPPGVHWSDAKPQVLPGVAGVFDRVAADRAAARKEVGGGVSEAEKQARRERRAARKAAAAEAKARAETLASGGLRFVAQPVTAGDAAWPGRAGSTGESGELSGRLDRPGKNKARVAEKNDPRLVALARELRDRWLEQAAAQPGLLVGGGKYEVSRRVSPGWITGGGERGIGVGEQAGLLLPGLAAEGSGDEGLASGGGDAERAA